MNDAEKFFSKSTSSNSYNDNLSMYSGNPNFLTLLPDGKTYQDITLEDLGLTIDGIKEQLYPMGPDELCDANGNPFPDSLYQDILYQVVGIVEKEFDICIRPRLQIDRMDYNQNNYNAYMNLRLTQRPILHVEDIDLYFNNQSLYDFPLDWVKAYTREGQIQIQPSVFMQAGTSGVLNNIYPLATIPMGINTNMYTANNFAPQMIGVSYVAGMLPVPDKEKGINRDCYIHPDLISYICKYGAVEILERWGRMPVGAGIASFQVSIDGISSGVGTTASAENSASSGEINNLLDDMKNLKNSLISYYGRNIGLLG